ncbi:MAG: hypothetical protein SFU98_17685 [Leptospiraceae bacterium]|nr:hypothetical protein [Leptospiraceae bacterium]
MPADKGGLLSSKAAKKVLSAKNPSEYIAITVATKLPRGERGVITKLWLEKTGYTIEDVMYARNRHPFWKSKKKEGAKIRQEKRLEEHNYQPKNYERIVWDKEKLKKFLDMNESLTDFELAKKFKTSIPSINHIRRKLKYSKILLEQDGKKVSKVSVLPLLMRAEKSLKSEISS